MLFSFGIFSLEKKSRKGGKNENSTSIAGQSIAVFDNFSESTHCEDRRKYSDRFTRETMTRIMKPVGGEDAQYIVLEHYKCPLIQSVDRIRSSVKRVG